MSASFRLAIVASTLWLAAACGNDRVAAPPARDTTVAPGVTPTQATLLAYTSTPGDWIGQGQSHSYGYADGTWSATGTTGPNGLHHIKVSFDVPSGGTWWQLNLEAPAGGRLTLGSYPGAQRWPFQASTSPGLDFSGSGRGCNVLSGSFEILELAADTSGTINRLQVHFIQHCESGSSYLDGRVAIHANPWW